jgi:hypothetical protein
MTQAQAHMTRLPRSRSFVKIEESEPTGPPIQILVAMDHTGKPITIDPVTKRPTEP